MITPALLRMLLGPQGQEALRAASETDAAESTFLGTSQRLARRFPADLARAAVVQVILRRKARAKFSAADRMFFTVEGLEQASGEIVADYRAGRFAGLSPLFDLTAGLGGDTLAMARQAPVAAVDRDRLRLALLAANASALGLAERVNILEADALRPAWRYPPGAGVFADPSRRLRGRRVRSVVEYEPPLGDLLEFRRMAPAMAVKVSPAVDLAEVAQYECEIEFIALEDELKDAVLWFGELRTARRRATVLPGPNSLTAAVEPDLPVGEPATFLYEPNPSVMRAGLVRTLGEHLGAHLLDRSIGYLTGERLGATPFARAFRIQEWMPFQLKRLRARLRDLGVGVLTVKKRGSALEPEVLIRQLGLRGPVEQTIVLTRVGGKPAVLLVEPLTHPPLPPEDGAAKI